MSIWNLSGVYQEKLHDMTGVTATPVYFAKCHQNLKQVEI